MRPYKRILLSFAREKMSKYRVDIKVKDGPHQPRHRIAGRSALETNSLKPVLKDSALP